MGKKHLAGWETTQWVKKNKKTTSFKKLISFLFKVPLRCLPSSKEFEPCEDFSEKGSLRASSPIWARRKPRENERQSREGPRKGELATIPHKFSFVLRSDEGKYNWQKNDVPEIKIDQTGLTGLP